MAYHAPTRLEDALALMAGGGVVPVAGCTDWYPAQGVRLPDQGLLDVTRLPGFRGIAKVDGGWRIGAATRWADVAAADLPAAFDGLRAAAREVGSVQIQNAGTVAGNLVNASPAADGVPPLLTLGAEVELVSATGRRVLALEDFVTGPRRTALRAGELVGAVLVPDPAPGACGAFVKAGARRYLVISIAMVAAVVSVADGRIAGARVAVGACSPVARRLKGLEARLDGADPRALPAVAPEDLAPLSPIDDVRGTAGFRLDVAATLVARVIAQAAHGAAAVAGPGEA
jgi:CO/xanthine dehydrogenase FAD-binding subunit